MEGVMMRRGMGESGGLGMVVGYSMVSVDNGLVRFATAIGEVVWRWMSGFLL
jgi:hypothetical protein